MGDLVPFPGRKGSRRRAPRVQRRRAEWRVYSHSRNASHAAPDEASALVMVDRFNTDVVDMPHVFGVRADWVVERRTVGNWQAL